MPAESVRAEDIVRELQACSIDYVLTVPDTHQKTLTAQLASHPSFKFLTTCTEDEAMAIYAGLWITGHHPVMLVQHAGIYASINHLRAVGVTMRVPLFILAGLFARRPELEPRAHKSSFLRYLEPLLDAFEVPYFRLDGPQDLPVIRQAHGLAWKREYPAVVLVGMPTL